jgi:exopolysaccharide biosynthesis polyprenyl glycosylphosphotransferase
MSLFADQSSAESLIAGVSSQENTINRSLAALNGPEPIASTSLAKRCFDIAFSLSVLVLLLPVLLMIAAAIKVDSRGPVFFRQTRWGRHQKQIRIYKFRTMKIDLCDETGVAQTQAGDPRVTRIGAFLRKSSLDELPQFINVLIGDMSVVGPRCHAIGMMASGRLYEQLVPEYHLRHRVRPGITGLAQVRGWRGPTMRRLDAKARIACDLYYIENYSFWWDIRIIVGTLKNELCGGTGF